MGWNAYFPGISAAPSQNSCCRAPLSGWPCGLWYSITTLFSWPLSSPNLAAGRSQGDLHAQIHQTWGWGGPSGGHLFHNPQRAQSYCHPRCQKERIEPTLVEAVAVFWLWNIRKKGQDARWQGDPPRSEPMEQGLPIKPSTKWSSEEFLLLLICLLASLYL